VCGQEPLTVLKRNDRCAGVAIGDMGSRLIKWRNRVNLVYCGQNVICVLIQRVIFSREVQEGDELLDHRDVRGTGTSRPRELFIYSFDTFYDTRMLRCKGLR
jgi:hypothetical protein